MDDNVHNAPLRDSVCGVLFGITVFRTRQQKNGSSDDAAIASPPLFHLWWRGNKTEEKWKDYQDHGERHFGTIDLLWGEKMMMEIWGACDLNEAQRCFNGLLIQYRSCWCCKSHDVGTRPVRSKQRQRDLQNEQLPVGLWLDFTQGCHLVLLLFLINSVRAECFFGSPLTVFAL